MTASILVPPFDEAARAAIREGLASGAVMTYPTETTPALGGNGLHEALPTEIRRLKGRPAEKALLLLIDGEPMLERFAAEIALGARALIARFWPGALTLVFRAAPGLPMGVVDSRGTVALRRSPHPVVAELLALGGVPLIGTSANAGGGPPLLSAREVLQAFGGAVSIAIDGASTPPPEWADRPGAPSTVVDTTVEPYRILREGAIPKSMIQAVLVESDIRAVPD